MERSRILKLGGILAAVCVLALYASSSKAVLSLNQASAFAASPILVLDNASAPCIQWTYSTVTNNSDQNVTLHLNFIDGRDWSAVDISCPVTAQETVLFSFRPTGAGTSAVDFKCSYAIPTPNGVIVQSVPTTVNLPFQRGLMTAAVEAPAGTTISANILVSEWLVVDFQNADAYGAPAITLQALAALNQDGNRDYRFDGKEYATFPAQLASNFIAPTGAVGAMFPQTSAAITAELVLFTLDGTLGGQPAAPGGQVNPVALRGNVYNDRESPQSFNFNFDCFRVVDLTTISPAFINTGPGGFMSPAGHFDLTPVATGAGDPAHEFNFGTGNNTRKRPVVGWIIQHLTTGAMVPNFVPNGAQQVISPAFPNIPAGASAGSWARTLGSSVTSFTPLAGDTPTFSTN